MSPGPSTVCEREREFLDNLALLEDWFSQYEYLLGFAEELDPLPEGECTEETRLGGCTAPAWMQLERTAAGTMALRGRSESLIVQAIMGLASSMIRDAPLPEIAAWAPSFTEVPPLRRQFAADRRKGVALMLRRIGEFARAGR